MKLSWKIFGAVVILVIIIGAGFFLRSETPKEPSPAVSIPGLPPDKQTIEDRYAQERAEGQLNPAAKLGDASMPPPSPPERQTPGIFQGEGGLLSKPYFVLNLWSDYDRNDNLVTVYAGGIRTEEEGLSMVGQLVIFTEAPNGDPNQTVVQHLSTPINSGPVRITTASGFHLGLLSSSGASFVFDVSSSTFIKTVATPDTVAPTCTQTVGVTAAGKTIVTTTLQDALSGLGSISTTTIVNATHADPLFSIGTNQPVVVQTTRVNQEALARVTIAAMDIAENRTTCPPIIMPVVGDVNSDGKVDCNDLALVRASFGKRTGQPGFNPAADLDGNGIIDVRDLAIVARKVPAGTVCK